MSLTALTVAASDIAQLEQGVQFFQSSAANQASVAASINAPGSTTSVFTYAASLLGQNSPSLGQVNMADTAILEGGTIPVGNATTTNTLTFLATSFLPAQFQVGSTLASLGVNPTLFASEALGLALASTAGFKAQYGNLTQAQFVSMISTQTGVGASFIGTFVQNWLNFYNGVGAAAVPAGLTALQAAEGAAGGDAIGAALFAPASFNLPLTTVFSTQTPQTPTQFSPNTVKGQVANALIGNAEGQYVTGVALGSLPAHTPLQGEFTTPATQNVFLTTGVDNATQGFSTSSTGSPLLNGFTATASNTTFNGTVGGTGATWTAGDVVTAATGTTGQTFNLQGLGTLGVNNVTSVGPGNKVSGIQTVNITASPTTVAGTTVPGQAIQGDFTATGPEGEWVGLTALNVQSGGNSAGADLLTVGAAVKVNVTDTQFQSTNQALTVNGSLTTTITENNTFAANTGGIIVNGGTGTTTVSVTQTQPNGAAGNDGFVKIVDGGFAAKAAGTITTVTLDGLSHTVPATFTSPGVGLVPGTPILNTIQDNALATLTINHSDTGGAAVSIVDNLTPATATTLTLNLLADGIGPNGFAVPLGGFPWSGLILTDTNNEISTIHLGLGAQNSVLHLLDNGLTTLDTPTAGTGALVGLVNGGPVINGSTITDGANAAVNFNFSGLNGPNNIDVDRFQGVNTDVFTLGNFGTNAIGTTPFQTAQHLVIENNNTNNTDTINFGSGAYDITDAPHPTTINPHSYVNTAPNGTNLAAGFTDATLQPWGEIINARFATNVQAATVGDTLTFKGDTVANSFNVGTVGSVAAGIAAGLANPQHSATAFQFAANVFVFDHAGTSPVNISPNDALVEFVGIVGNPNITTSPGGILHLQLA